MDILSNAWVVGIGGGILSGLIVAIITRKIFSKRDNREYLQKVQSANQEVLYAIRPGISEGVIPNSEIVLHLVEATARKYSVEVESMHGISSIASELIKEVMDSSFISAQTKQDFCEKLSALSPNERNEVTSDYIREIQTSSKYRTQMVAILAAVTGLTTSIAAFYISTKPDSLELPDQFAILLVPAFAAILISFVSVLVKELSKAKLTSFKVNVGGLKADFVPRESNGSKNT